MDVEPQVNEIVNDKGMIYAISSFSSLRDSIGRKVTEGYACMSAFKMEGER